MVPVHMAGALAYAKQRHTVSTEQHPRHQPLQNAIRQRQLDLVVHHHGWGWQFHICQLSIVAAGASRYKAEALHITEYATEDQLTPIKGSDFKISLWREEREFRGFKLQASPSHLVTV